MSQELSDTDFKNLSEILEKTIINIEITLNSYYKINYNTINQCVEIINQSKIKNKKESCDLNIFDFFDIYEKKHSILLGELLNPYGKHGQGSLFLLNFLDKLGIENPAKGDWKVLIEKGHVDLGRIDILLIRNHPHSIVIIENKAIDASDQPNQLYRYWFFKIYEPNIKNKAYESEKHFKILYLPSGKCFLNSPPEDSISRPKNNDYFKYAPDRIPSKTLATWYFKKQYSEFSKQIINYSVVSWLEEILNLTDLEKDNHIGKENHRLRTFIEQYIEIWS